MFGLNPLLVSGALALVIGGAWWLGHESGLQQRDGKLGNNFEKALAIEREVALRREVNLWTQIGDERQARVELITTMQKVDALSAEARAKMIAALAAEKAASEAALSEAMRNIAELKDAASAAAKDWKAGVIPPDITCGVFDAKGCPAPAYPATGADRQNDLAVREPAAPLRSAAHLP